MAVAERVISLPGRVRIDVSELEFAYSRSPGPGGQNVNKTSTRTTLHFDVAGTSALSPAQKERIADALPGRMSREGVLRVTSSKHRTQGANRGAAIERFTELLTEALRVRKPRQNTAIPARAHAQRLAYKRERGQRKRLRGRVGADD